MRTATNHTAWRRGPADPANHHRHHHQSTSPIRRHTYWLGSTAVLQEILRVTAEARPATWPTDDLVRHMTSYRAWQAQLPSELGLGGDYIARHVARKHAICRVRLGGSTRSAGGARGRLVSGQSSTGRDLLRRPSDASSGTAATGGTARTSTRDLSIPQLQQICPDQAAFLSSIPHSLLPMRRLTNMLGVDALMITCWACLNHEALGRARDAWPDVDLCDAAVSHPDKLREALSGYLAETGVAPCPWILTRRFMTAVFGPPRQVVADASCSASEALDDAPHPPPRRRAIGKQAPRGLRRRPAHSDGREAAGARPRQTATPSKTLKRKR